MKGKEGQGRARKRKEDKGRANKTMGEREKSENDKKRE